MAPLRHSLYRRLRFADEVAALRPLGGRAQFDQLRDRALSKQMHQLVTWGRAGGFDAPPPKAS